MTAICREYQRQMKPMFLKNKNEYTSFLKSVINYLPINSNEPSLFVFITPFACKYVSKLFSQVLFLISNWYDPSVDTLIRKLSSDECITENKGNITEVSKKTLLIHLLMSILLKNTEAKIEKKAFSCSY